MKKFLISGIFVCLGYMFADAQRIKRIDGSTIFADKLSEKIRTLMSKAHVSGLAISVFNKNTPVFSQTYGLADVQVNVPLNRGKIMYASALGQTVFAYIMAQLVQEKVIDLDKPLVSYLSKPLPDYKIPGKMRGYEDIKDDKRYQQITARMCLDHTTGLSDWRWLEAGNKLKIKFNPGHQYSYSGEGMYLLQFVVEQITGKDLETIAKEKVFTPLGMANTSYVWHDDYENELVLGHDTIGKPYEFIRWKEANCVNSLCTSLEDYTKFFTGLLQHPNLSKAIFNQMILPQVYIRSVKQFGPLSLNESTDNDNIKLGYGLGFGVFKTPEGRAFFKEGHDAGWEHYSVAYPDKDIAVIIMTNSDNGESIFKQLLADSIADIYTPWEWEDYIPNKALSN